MEKDKEGPTPEAKPKPDPKDKTVKPKRHTVLYARGGDDSDDDDDEKEKDEEQEVLTYAETLHKALTNLWLPMVIMGRIPFWLILKNNRAHIVVHKKSFPYIFCFVSCVLTWVLFAWITTGFLMLAGRTPTRVPVLNTQVTSHVSVNLARRFWMDLFIFWTVLLQAAISSSHILYKAEELARFVQDWYRALDITKIEVSRTLALYILKSHASFGCLIFTYILSFSISSFQHTTGTCGAICIALAQPLIIMLKLTDEKTRFEDDTFYFQRHAWVGLIVYILAMLLSWMYIMQFMVFCRCFRKGLKCMNDRIAMILCIDNVQRVGPNALRLTYELIHKDYLGITSTGMKIGKIFSWTMCNYYLWAILVLVVELGEIFKFAKKEFHKKTPSTESENYILEQVGIPPISPGEEIFNSLIHFIITTSCIFYVSHEGSGAHKEGKKAYELARYKGLVDCTSQLERNFVRSIWIIVSEKCPVHVSPGKFFGITNSTVMTVFATAFTYFIFWVQSLGQLEKLKAI